MPIYREIVTPNAVPNALNVSFVQEPIKLQNKNKNVAGINNNISLYGLFSDTYCIGLIYPILFILLL